MATTTSGGNGEETAITKHAGSGHDAAAGANGETTNGDEGAKGPDADKPAEDDEDNLFDPDVDCFEFEDWPHGVGTRCVCRRVHEDGYEFDGNLEEFLWRYGYDGDDENDDIPNMLNIDAMEYASRLWEHRGVPLGWFESSYLAGHETSKTRSLDGSVVNYDHCTATELQLFARERGLADPYPAGLTLKFFYIRLLEKDDKELHAFRFMDLPPEMRLMVYGELLTLKPTTGGKRGCSPAILRTCRQVYDEAKDTLFRDNTIIAKFEISLQGDDGIAQVATVHNDSLPSCTHGRYVRLPQGIDDYPDFLRRVPSLEIQLSIKALDTDAPFPGLLLPVRPFNHFLYCLASFLMEGNCIQQLRVKIDIGGGGEDDDYDYCAALYPLRRLRNIPHVTFEGSAPTILQKKLQNDLCSKEPTFNTLRQWKLLKDEVTQQRQVYRALGVSYCDCGECHDPDEEFEEMEYFHASLEENVSECCTNSKREENFIARLSLLKSALRNNNDATDRLQALLQARLDAHAATTAHHDANDAGRLEEAETIWEGRITEDEMMDYMDVSDIDELDDNNWSGDEAEDEDLEIVGDSEIRQPLNTQQVAEAINILDSRAGFDGQIL